MSDAVTLDSYTFLTLLIADFVLGVLVGIVWAPLLDSKGKAR